MKLLALGFALLSGGSAVAMENETVSETVTNTATQIRTMIQKKLQGNLFETVKESGFPYPSEEYLAALTEDQAFEIVSAIDVINATYDWQNMTDEEIIDALALVKVEMQELYTALGVESPAVQTRTQTRTQTRQGGNDNGKGNKNTEPKGTQERTCTEENLETNAA
jgi:hypothetical protein